MTHRWPLRINRWFDGVRWAGVEMDRFPVEIEVTIRPARSEDLRYLGSWPGFDTPAHRQALRYYLALQRRGGGMLIVAEAGGHPIGQLFLWYRREDPQLGDGRSVVSITALRVWTPFRRHGVATRLARAAEEYARRAGFQVMTIGADEGNDAAYRLYRSWGYREFKRSTYEWDGKILPQICLSKELASDGDQAQDVRARKRPAGEDCPG